jgi:DNA polymerase III gamma/tau subunit
MSLYLKHRPKSFKEILGNEEVIQSVQNMVKEPDDCPHSFLFHGPRGCGKTTVARILGKELGIKGQDLREMDSADFRGIDAVRDIRQQAHYKPLEGSRRMWILDEAHQLTNAAQSALLKMLEDTPEHVYFALCTTDPQKLLGTVKDRCSGFQMQPLDDGDMKKLLIGTCKKEGEKPSKKVLLRILKDSDGHPRQALQTLDQVLRVDPERRMEAAKQSQETENQSIELCRALVQNNPWGKVRRILKGLKKQDEESIRRHVLGYARAVLLNGDNPRAGAVLEEFIEPFYSSGFPGLVFACYCIVKS